MNSEMGLSSKLRRLTAPVCVMIRGELAMGRISRHTLVFGRSVRILTMMQSCASAAKLRGGGPILAVGICAMSAAGSRHLGSSSADPNMGRQAGCPVVAFFACCRS